LRLGLLRRDASDDKKFGLQFRHLPDACDRGIALPVQHPLESPVAGAEANGSPDMTGAR
jgi:hypothetical protein